MPQPRELSVLMPLNLLAAPRLALAQGTSAKDERKNSEQIQTVDGSLLTASVRFQFQFLLMTAAFLVRCR